MRWLGTALEGRLQRAHSIDDLRALARRALPRMVFDYVDGAAQSENTARLNRDALEALKILPGTLCDVSARSSVTNLFGRPMSLPLIVGPTGFNSVFWPRGDVALARAASKFGIPFVMSWGANVSLADIRADAPARHWFQFNPPLARERWGQILASVGDAGFEAVEITVDAPVPGRRVRDLRNEFGLPLRWTLGKVAQVAAHPRWGLRALRHGMPKPVVIEDAFADGTRNRTMSDLASKLINPSVTWDDLKNLRDLWRGPLIVKGLSNPHDVERSATFGFDAVVVSNHGGRQLDASVSTIEVLPACVAAAQGRIPVLIDSGFRSGTDVFKALTLGAAAVQIGRAALYGLAAGGQLGVERALSILAAELDVTMALTGVTSITQSRVIEDSMHETLDSRGVIRVRA